MMNERWINAGRFWNAPLLIAMVTTFAILLYFIGRPVPILIWDEGRIIISAMEMRLSGIGLVTTYDFHQDLWNTKPPLLVWLMTGSMALLGPTEFALRLPSFLSAVGTVLLVMLFLHRIARSAAIAAFGGIALAASISFFGEHGARTADYDALLTFFTTSYLMLLFFAMHRSRPPRTWLLLAGLMGAGALMTKGVAGAIPGAGFLLYLLIARRSHRVFKNAHYLVGALLATAPILSFLILRERADPGYLEAMIYNDVSGRFKEALDNHAGPPWYYVDITFFGGLFSLGIAALLPPFTLPITRGRVRLALIFSCCIAFAQLVVLMMTSTKLSHYYLAAYPFIAIASALAFHAILIHFRAQVSSGTLPRYGLWVVVIVPTLVLIFGVAKAFDVDRTLLFEREHYPRTRYGVLLDVLSNQRAPILAIEPGWRIPDDYHYAPELRYYMMIAREEGRVVQHAGDLRDLNFIPSNVILATCDPLTASRLKARVEIVVEKEGCIAGREAGRAQPYHHYQHARVKVAADGQALFQRHFLPSLKP